MRIDRLEIENFKGFAKQSFTLDPHFTLFVGENGSGKTSVLDALAVAASVWLIEPPDSSLNSSRRDILESEIRLEPEVRGDRTQFRMVEPVSIRAYGQILDVESLLWVRTRNELDGEAKIISEGELSLLIIATALIGASFARDKAGENLIFPIVSHYGAGRAWLFSPRDKVSANGNGPARRWSAFRNCFSGRIDFEQLNVWFRREHGARGNRGGRWRPGFEVVRRAIVNCLPDADEVWFDVDRDEIVLSIDGTAQPLSNLSAGQGMMMALVADIAIKAVTQNAFLLPPDELAPDDNRLLEQTPGLVLIDELDVHLHPKWQRHVARDLKATFPAIQFVCTSHSPQIIGELKPDEIRVLDNNIVSVPPRSFGMDSNRVLEELMDAPSRDESVQELLNRLFEVIDREDFDSARKLIPEVEARLGPDDPELTRAHALISFLESSA